ncbi:hypothetical protein [Nocardia rosealba]|uniref:hypothetical protein n=1 Tax=Nocardia rosealba TaxID=2878563 RepID=UPI001CD9FD4D|nr:hypothetical protein [Nocardia rosealba]MCA2207376.1 hypothetical protein [Nocardia rosealba]
MTAALLAASAAVVGIVIGRFWDQRAETTRWQRDKRADSYQQLTGAFRTSYDTIQQIALADTPDDHIATVDNHVWHEALCSVWIYGTPEAVLAAARLDRILTQTFTAAKNRQHSASEWAVARVPARHGFEQFLATIRAEVSRQAIPSTFYDNISSIEPR